MIESSTFKRFLFTSVATVGLLFASHSAEASICYVQVQACDAGVATNVWFQDWDYSANIDVSRCVARASDFHFVCHTDAVFTTFYDNAGANTFTAYKPPVYPISSGGTWANFGPFDLAANHSINFGAMSLSMQNDGNLVLYKSGNPVWASGAKYNCPNCHASFQTDGNLVIYDGGTPIWDTGTIAAQIDAIEIDEQIPYFKMHSKRIDYWAVVPNGDLILPDGTVLSGLVSFR